MLKLFNSKLIIASNASSEVINLGKTSLTTKNLVLPTNAENLKKWKKRLKLA